MQTKKNNLKININKDDSGLNDFLYLWDIFKTRPNKVLIHGTFDFKETENFFDQYEKVNKFPARSLNYFGYMVKDLFTEIGSFKNDDSIYIDSEENKKLRE